MSLASAASGAPLSTPPGPSQARRAVVPVPTPDLDNMDALVREQIQERQRWHRRVIETSGADAKEQILAYGELGTLYHAYGLPDAAEACYRNAAQLAPNDYRWPYYLALLYRDRNDSGSAIASFERALTAAPNDVPTLIRLAEVQLDQNRPELASPLLDKAVKIDRTNAAALAALGQIALSRRDFGRAAGLLERALALQPAASSLRSPLALAYRGLGDAGKAGAQIEQHGTGEVTLNDPLLRKLHGLAKAQREHQQRGAAAFAAGRVDEAIAEFRQSVREDPLYSVPRVNLALALLKTEALDQAAEELSMALTTAPESPQAHFAFGYVRAQQGAQSEALGHYRAAVTSDPEYVDAWFNLAASLAALGRHEDAAAAYAEVVGRRPDWPLARLHEASSLILADRDADARARLDAAAAAMPRDGYVAHALARLLATSPDGAVRDGAQALVLAEALFKARPSLEHAETMAMALAELGRFDDAVRWQREAMTIAEQNSRNAEQGLLERRLALYQRGEPCRAPWKETGEVVPFPGAAR